MLFRSIAGINAAIGKVSAKNAGASKLLHAQYAGTVVFDEPERSVVINLSTVDQGAAMLQALRVTLGDRVVPSEYTPEERARFGRFVPRAYPRS